MKSPIKIIALTALLAATSLFAAPKNAPAYNQAGYELLSRGDYIKASAQFISALAQNPAYLEARLGLAKCHLALEAYFDAYDIYNKVLQRQSDNRDAMLGLADALSGLGKYDRALEQYNAVVEKYNESIEAHYGIARIYHLMGKNVWAMRRIDTIYKLNPFHYETLVLNAEIKGDAGRLDEAEGFIKKAIESNPQRDDGYVAYGRVFLRKFFASGSNGYVDDAIEEFNRALAIRPDNIKALQFMGLIAIIRGDYQSSSEFYQRAAFLSPKTSELQYSLGYSFDQAARREDSIEAYRRCSSLNSDDDINQNALENALVMNDFEIGFPVRTDMGDYYYNLAKESFRNNFAGVGEMYLRKAVMMNPLNRVAREELRDYYQAVGYDRFYIDQIKALQKLFPGNKYREELNLAVIKRRNSMYFNAGYATEEPVRDIPNVLVLNFFPAGDMSKHPGAGGVIADAITFAGGQFGRMKMGSIGYRRVIVRESDVFAFSGIDDYVNYLSDKVSDDNPASQIDYIVYGTYYDRPYTVEMNVKMMNFKTGVVISDFNIYDTGKNFLTRASYRIAKKLYEAVPYRGRILEMKEDGAIINLGSFDGLKKDDYLFAFHENDITVKGKYKIRKKILLKIDDIDTDVCRALPATNADRDFFRANMEVFPVTMKRAVRIE